MKIAIFGGAFDPPHVGHQAIAAYLLDAGISDQVWWTPTGQHPFDKSMSAAKHRRAMIELLIEAHPNQKLCPWELEQAETSYTIDTITYLKTEYPEHQFQLVIGSDNVVVFEKWHSYQEILEEVPVLVYPREGFPFQEHSEQFEFLTQAPVVIASSTQVRQQFQAGLSSSDLVDPRVAEYSVEHQLYKKK